MQDNRYSLNRTLGLAIAVIALVAIAGSGSVLLAMAQLRDATYARYRSTEVITALGAFRAAMLDQETSARGYLLTGRPGSLEPYAAGRADLDRAVVRLHALLDERSEQRASLQGAEQAARTWQHEVGELIAGSVTNPTRRERARLVEATGSGKQAFDAFRVRLDAIAARERLILLRQSQIVADAQRTAERTLWASAIVTLLICIGAGLAISRIITRPLGQLADATRRLVQRDTDVRIPSLRQRNEVGAMARAVAVLRDSLMELDRTSVLRLTADTMPAMIGYVDAGRRIGFLNQEFARRFDLGVDDVAELQNRPVEQAFSGGRFPGAAAELPAALAGQEMRFAFRLNEGEVPHDFEGYLRPHRAPDGRVLGVVALFTDVTDRKEIDRQLRGQAADLKRSNAELEQFAYVASHDLKAPLRGIENLASWIEEDLGDALTGDARTNMDLLKSRVRRLEALLSDLLAYSRAGRGDDLVREVDSGALVDELAALLSPPEGLRIVAAPGLPTLQTARAPLAQVLQNLIGNAIKHHPDPAHGLIEVSAQARDNQYVFTVTDNGPGIPPRFRERVFGMFQTLRPRDEVEGSGMGLAIVRKLVDRQGGTVWLDDARGGGLAVHFTWPASSVLAKSAPADVADAGLGAKA